jgi:EmrB/QacA subfamily drug resistance transporter
MWVLAATILVSGMAALLGRSVSLALPAIQSSLHADITGIQWVINSFGLIMAVFILIGGSLGDHFGRKRILGYGIAIFVVGCVLSALSRNIGQLIAAQCVIGVGAVMTLPACLSIINVSFLESEKGRAIGLWAGFGAAFGVAGFLLGGLIIQTLGWRTIFSVNIPIGIFALFVTLKFVPESRSPDAKHIDWLGTLWLALGLLGISYALIYSPLRGMKNLPVIGSIAGGAASVILFLFWQRRAASPLVPLHLFRSSVIVRANLVTFFLYFALNGVYVFVVVYFQQQFRYSPTVAGAAMLPASLLVALFSGRSGALTDRIGPRIPMAIGAALTALGVALFMIPGVQVNYFTAFLPAVMVLGFSMVVFVAPLTKAALAVDPKYSGVASGVNNGIARISGLFAIAVLGAVMAFVFTHQLHRQLPSSGLTTEQQSQILQQANRVGGLEVPSTFDSRATDTARNIVQASLLQSFRWAMGISAAVAALAALSALLFVRRGGWQATNGRERFEGAPSVAPRDR